MRAADAIGFPYRGPGIVQVGSDNDNNAFTLVTRKKKNRKHQNGRTFKERTPAEKVERSMAELRSDVAWMRKCTEIVRNTAATLPSAIQEILCLGLGSPTDSAQARFQLCFLLELRDSILSNPVRIRAFDPVFSSEDKLLLESLDIEVLLDNKEGKHELEEGRTTLAYMPHCDRDLYENFLRANWSAASLSALLLIGNDLRGYTESVPSRVLGMESPCISRLGTLHSPGIIANTKRHNGNANSNSSGADGTRPFSQLPCSSSACHIRTVTGTPSIPKRVQWHGGPAHQPGVFNIHIYRKRPNWLPADVVVTATAMRSHIAHCLAVRKDGRNFTTQAK